MKRIALAAIVCLGSTLASGEEIQNPMSAGLTGLVKNYIDNAIDAATAMPASDYDFRPVAEARSFGEIVAHLSDANRTFCAAASGKPQPVDPRSERLARNDGRTKDELVAELRTSLEPCDRVLASLDDERLSELIPFGGGALIDGRPVRESKLPLATVLTILATHTSQHYGNMATYLRMKGVVPPSSRNIGEQRP